MLVNRAIPNEHDFMTFAEAVKRQVLIQGRIYLEFFARETPAANKSYAGMDMNRLEVIVPPDLVQVVRHDDGSVTYSCPTVLDKLQAAFEVVLDAWPTSVNVDEAWVYHVNEYATLDGYWTVLMIVVLTAD